MTAMAGAVVHTSDRTRVTRLTLGAALAKPLAPCPVLVVAKPVPVASDDR